MKTLELRHFYSSKTQVKEAYQKLQGKIVYYGNNMKIIGVTSYSSEKEKSRVAIGVAITMAEVGKRVLLIDGDFQQEPFDDMIAEEEETTGFSDYLIGAKEAEDIIYHTDIQQLDVVFGGTVKYSVANFTCNDKFGSRMKDLIDDYDYVIVASPPLDRDLDGMVIAQICDGMVIVLKEKSISDSQGKKCLARLEETGTPVLGTVLLSDIKWENNICFAASTGGHYEQLLMLRPLMDQYNSFLVTEKTKFQATDKEIGKVYYLKQVNRKNVLFPFRMLSNLWRSLVIYWKERPDVVITTGVMSMIPICLLVKLFHGKLIYIESFAKINTPTKTGKFLYRYADLFFVQWEELLAHYPKAIFKGGIY